MERPPTEPPFPTESRPGNAHSTSIHGEMHDVYKLVRAAETAPLSHRPMTSLFLRAVQTRGWSDGQGNPLRMRDVLKAVLRANTERIDWEAAKRDNPMYAKHIDRIRDADCRYPILLDQDGDIIDGMHRIAKAFLEQRETLPVRQFSSIPAWTRMDESD